MRSSKRSMRIVAFGMRHGSQHSFTSPAITNSLSCKVSTWKVCTKFLFMHTFWSWNVKVNKEWRPAASDLLKNQCASLDRAIMSLMSPGQSRANKYGKKSISWLKVDWLTVWLCRGYNYGSERWHRLDSAHRHRWAGVPRGSFALFSATDACWCASRSRHPCVPQLRVVAGKEWCCQPLWRGIPLSFTHPMYGICISIWGMSLIFYLNCLDWLTYAKQRPKMLY